MKKEIKDCMTSELSFQLGLESTTSEEKVLYLKEYSRRLNIMHLTEEQIIKFRKADEDAIRNGCYIKEDVLLLAEPFIRNGMDANSIKLKNCTFSELIYLTDDANSAYSRDHHWLSHETWNLVCEHALNFGLCKSAYEAQNRMKGIGLSQEQIGIFIRNECQLAKRLRWRYSKELAWKE